MLPGENLRDQDKVTESWETILLLTASVPQYQNSQQQEPKLLKFTAQTHQNFQKTLKSFMGFTG